MTGQHWDELARTVCKTQHISIWELCRRLDITPPTYYRYARNGINETKRVKMMGKIRKFFL